jgi:DNA end-binding protein Ku
VPRERRPHKGKRSAARGREPEAPANAPIAHGVWSGSISFGLVTIAVELFSAARKRRPGLRMLGPDGIPLARQYVCSRDERPLEREEITRGYEIEPGKFVVVSDEELDELAPRRSRDIELSRFVARDAIDPAYFVRPYFVLPGEGHSKAYRLLADVMESTGRAAIAHFVMSGKAYAVAIFADRGILRAETLRFGDELRKPQDLGVVASGKADATRVSEIQRAITKLERDELDASALSDPEASSLLELAQQKLKREQDVVRAPEIPAEEEPETDGEAAESERGEERGGEVIDLFALIQQRLRETPPKPGPRFVRRKSEQPRRSANAKSPRERG